MQILITHGTLARTRVLHFNRWQMAAMLISLVAVLTLLSGTVYHFVFLKAAREGWPVVSQIVRLVVRDGLIEMRQSARNQRQALHQWPVQVAGALEQLDAADIATRVGVVFFEDRLALGSAQGGRWCGLTVRHGAVPPNVVREMNRG